MNDFALPHFWERIRSNARWNGFGGFGIPKLFNYKIADEVFEISVKAFNPERYKDAEHLNCCFQQFVFTLRNKFIFEATFDYGVETYDYRPDGKVVDGVLVLEGARQYLKDDFVKSKLTLIGDTSEEEVNHHLVMIALLYSDEPFR